MSHLSLEAVLALYSCLLENMQTPGREKENR